MGCRVRFGSLLRTSCSRVHEGSSSLRGTMEHQARSPFAVPVPKEGSNATHPEEAGHSTSATPRTRTRFQYNNAWVFITLPFRYPDGAQNLVERPPPPPPPQTLSPAPRPRVRYNGKASPDAKTSQSSRVLSGPWGRFVRSGPQAPPKTARNLQHPTPPDSAPPNNIDPKPTFAREVAVPLPRAEGAPLRRNPAAGLLQPLQERPRRSVWRVLGFREINGEP